MAESQPPRQVFDVPATGAYHFVTGMQPHRLFAECTAACGTLAADGSAVPVVVEWETVDVGEEGSDVGAES